RRAQRVGRRLVAGLVEEASRRARQEDRVVLLQIVGREHRGIPRGVGRPGAGFLSELLDGLRRKRNRRVLETGGRDAREDQDLVGLQRLGRGGRRKNRHHLLDVARAGNGRLLTASAARIVQAGRRRAGDELRRRPSSASTSGAGAGRARRDRLGPERRIQRGGQLILRHRP